ncbi:MAG: alpha/beta fold hydrolase [Spirochaetales bacterium]|nr:alpha/beta fold hydrolase [Spirochaetales bacterium]
MKQVKIVFYIVALIFCAAALCGAQPEPEHFVLVHGAWHGAWCWYKLAVMLEEDGHTVTLIDLPGHGIDSSDPADVTLDDYRDRITGVLDSIPEEVILVGHSMGGIAISAAAESRPTDIKKLIYLSAFLLQSGQSMLDIALQDTGSHVLPNLIILPEEGIIDINRENLVDMFYQLSPAEDVSLARTVLKPNPIAPFSTPLIVTEPNYGSVERFYIFTLEDNAITYPIQQMMVAASPCRAVFVLDTDHSSFFSEPKNLIKVIDDILLEKY